MSESHVLALSVRQPWADQIIDGTKKFEYRRQPTNIRGRVFIDASLGIYRDLPGVHARDGRVRGKVIGSVEITGCSLDENGHGYAWHLARPGRMTRPRAIARRANPVWFRPW